MSGSINLAKDANNSITLQCPGSSLNSEIIHYGLAYKENVVLGFDLQARVETLKGCSYGDTKDVRKEWAL